MLVRRLISGVLVFFVVTIVQFIISLVSDNDAGVSDCVNCFINNQCTIEGQEAQTPDANTQQLPD